METLNLTLRQRKILHIIQDETDYITGLQLSRELNVSPRTIRTDIAAINSSLAVHDARILSERSKGYLYKAKDPGKIKQLNRIDTAFFSKEDRVRFLTFRLCLSDEPLNLYDLEDEMFVSHTTLLYDLHVIKMRYVLGKPNICMILFKNNISFEHEEQKIRTILLQLFHDGWDYNASANAYYGYQFLQEDIMQMILEEVPLLLRQNHIRMEDPGVIALDLSLAIMYHRCETGHPLPDSPSLPHTDTVSDLLTQDIFRFLEEELDCSFPQSEKENIYRQVSVARLPDLSLVTRETLPDFVDAAAIETADEYLERIFRILGLDFSPDDDFYITLVLYLQDLKSDQTIFNRQGNRNVAKETLSAEFEIAWLFQETALEKFGHLLSETELIYLAQCISGAIEFYFVNHPEKKLRTVLCCHRNMPSAWALKRKVLGAFSNYLDITDLIPVNTKNAFDFSETDLILSTVSKSITDRRQTGTLQINYLLPPSDMTSISSYIQHHMIRSLCPEPDTNLRELFSSAYWMEDMEYTERFPIIEALAGSFIRDGIATEQHLTDILKRESVSSFLTGPGLVFLHTFLPAQETRLAFMTLRHRVMWNGLKVRTIIMGVFRKEEINLLFQLKYLFNVNVPDTDWLKERKQKEEIIDFFLGHAPS